MSPGQKTAWLLETKTGSTWLGVDGSELRFTSPGLALRFAREEDALAMARWLERREGLELVATEHAWL